MQLSKYSNLGICARIAQEKKYSYKLRLRSGRELRVSQQDADKYIALGLFKIKKTTNKLIVLVISEYSHPYQVIDKQGNKSIKYQPITSNKIDAYLEYNLTADQPSHWRDAVIKLYATNQSEIVSNQVAHFLSSLLGRLIRQWGKD